MPRLFISIFSGGTWAQTMSKYLLKPFLLGCYALLFAEIFLRIFSPQALFPRYVTGSDIGIRQNVPNAIYWHQSPEIRVEMRINSAGIRSDKEFPIEKPQGTCRIVILGDSFFMGYEASLDESFAGRLEARLAKANKECEVINLAVSGFGTAESLIQLKEKGLQYQPDYVVLEWHESDIADNIRSNLFIYENEEIVRLPTEYLPAIKTRDKLMEFGVYRWLIENCHLYTALRHSLSVFVKDLLVKIKNNAKTPAPHSEYTESVTIEEKANQKSKPSLNLHSALVTEIVRTAERAGAKSIVLDVPWERFDGKTVSSFDDLEGQPNDIVLISPKDELDKLLEDGEMVYFKKGHRHFTPAGYDALAKVTAEAILEQDLPGEHEPTYNQD